MENNFSNSDTSSSIPGAAPAAPVDTPQQAPSNISEALGDKNSQQPPMDLPGAAQTDRDIFNATQEKRINDGTREIQKQIAANKLSQQQLQEMGKNYSSLKSRYENTVGAINEIRSALEKAQQSGETLQASELLHAKNTLLDLEDKKARFEEEIGSLGSKYQRHQEAEAKLQPMIAEQIRNDTLDLATRIAPELDGNRATAYQILKTDIIPRIEASDPGLVDAYVRGEISLENLVRPTLAQNMSLYKQLYTARDGGSIAGGASAPSGGSAQPKSNFAKTFGLL